MDKAEQREKERLKAEERKVSEGVGYLFISPPFAWGWALFGVIVSPLVATEEGSPVQEPVQVS